MNAHHGARSAGWSGGCSLCEARRLTEWLFEDDECWVADCMVCATPMIVWRPHGLPERATEDRLLARLNEVAAGRYGSAGYWIDPERRRIPDHWHAHARPRGGFFGRDASRGEAWWKRVKPANRVRPSAKVTRPTMATPLVPNSS